MIIEIKNTTTRKQKRRFNNVVRVLAEYLIPAKTRDKLFITVKILNDLDDEWADGFTDLIYCDKDEIEIHVEVLRDMDEEEIIKTLAHEMVHVRQYACKQLADAPNNMMKWKGKLFEYNDESPWEQEAYNLEQHLVELVHKHEQTNWQNL